MPRSVLHRPSHKINVAKSLTIFIFVFIAIFLLISMKLALFSVVPHERPGRNWWVTSRLSILYISSSSNLIFVNFQLMTEENRISSSLFHFESLFSKLYRRYKRDSSSKVYYGSGLDFLSAVLHKVRLSDVGNAMTIVYIRTVSCLRSIRILL